MCYSLSLPLASTGPPGEIWVRSRPHYVEQLAGTSSTRNSCGGTLLLLSIVHRLSRHGFSKAYFYFLKTKRQKDVATDVLLFCISWTAQCAFVCAYLWVRRCPECWNGDQRTRRHSFCSCLSFLLVLVVFTFLLLNSSLMPKLLLVYSNDSPSPGC